MNSVLQSKVALPLPSLGACTRTCSHTQTHTVAVDRSCLASQHESVAEASHQSSAPSCSLFALAQQHPAGFDHTCSFPPGHTHCGPGLTASVSICSVTGSCSTTTMCKEGRSQAPVTPFSQQATSSPLSILVLLIFLPPAFPADRALGSILQPLGLPPAHRLPVALVELHRAASRSGSREDMAACSPPAPSKS